MLVVNGFKVRDSTSFQLSHRFGIIKRENKNTKSKEKEEKEFGRHCRRVLFASPLSRISPCRSATTQHYFVQPRSTTRVLSYLILNHSERKREMCTSLRKERGRRGLYRPQWRFRGGGSSTWMRTRGGGDKSKRRGGREGIRATDRTSMRDSSRSGSIPLALGDRNEENKERKRPTPLPISRQGNRLGRV